MTRGTGTGSVGSRRSPPRLGQRSRSAGAGRRRRRRWASDIAAVAAIPLAALAIILVAFNALAPPSSGAHPHIAAAHETVALRLPELGHSRFYVLILHGTLMPGEHVTRADFSVHVANAGSLPANVRIASAQGKPKASGDRWTDQFWIAINQPTRSNGQDAAGHARNINLVIDSSAAGTEKVVRQAVSCLRARAKRWQSYRLENQSPGGSAPLTRFDLADAEGECVGG